MKTPGRSRTANRYDPWAQANPEPKPEPEPTSAAQARTWAQFWRAVPAVNHHRWAARIPAPPYRLDWQRNPRAPLPPGYVRVRCLCGGTIVRTPDCLPKPRTTVGSPCFLCGAPLQRAQPGEPYRTPDGWVMTRCLCRVSMHKVISVTSFTLPTELCEDCGAPPQMVEHDQEGYVIDLELPEQPGWQQYWDRQGLLAWAAGTDTPQG